MKTAAELLGINSPASSLYFRLNRELELWNLANPANQIKPIKGKLYLKSDIEKLRKFATIKQKT